MSEVNEPQNYLNQSTEQDFQDNLNARKKLTSDNIHFNPNTSILIQETATQALNRVTFGAKKMVEEQVGVCLGSNEDNWWFHGYGTEGHIADIFGKPGPRGHNIIDDEELMIRLMHSPEYLQEEARKRRENFSLQNSNREYTQVDIDVAILELERIAFISENILYSTIVGQIRASHEEMSEGDIEISRIQSLILLIKKFHFFAVQYHYLSFKETTEQQDEFFQAGLMHFFEEIKVNFNPDLKVIDPLDEVGIPDFGYVPGVGEHRRDKR